MGGLLMPAIIMGGLLMPPINARRTDRHGQQNKDPIMVMGPLNRSNNQNELALRSNTLNI